MKEHKKRICVIIHNYFPYTETRALRQIDALLANNFIIDVICLKQKDDLKYEKNGNLSIYRVPVKYKRNALFLRLFNVLHFFFVTIFKLNSLCIKRRYSAIQIHTHITSLIFIGLWQRLNGVPLILDIHDLLPEFFGAKYKKKFYGILYKLVFVEERISCLFAKHIIVVTEFDRRLLIKRKINPKKITVVMNLPDMTYFSKIEHPNNNFKEIHLIYYGSLIRFYGLDIAIHGVNQLIEEIKNIKLTIIGEGHHKKYLEKLINDLNLNSYISLLNPISPDEIPNYINPETIGISTILIDTHTRRAIPTKLMEYSAMGLPVISSELPIYKYYFRGDMIEYFKAGSPDDFANAVRILYMNPKRRSQIAKNITHFGKEYNWATEKQKLINLFCLYHKN